MAASSKIRVGIVGANPSRGFASVAHIPALRALPEFEITAVCTTRQDSAEAAARHLGARLAFSDKNWRSIPTSIWSRSASRCPIITRR